MERRFSAFVLCCLAFITLFTAPAQAVIDPESYCPQVCGAGDPCASCLIWVIGSGATPTTCGQYWGRPANDLDGDGVINTSDNCQCLANSNQANCDFDAYGDACDLQDNSWRRISVGTRNCYLDEDEHIYVKTLELYYQDVYRSSCTGQTCYDKYLKDSVDCPLGSNIYNCCQDEWDIFECGGVWNQDTCGLPRCNF